MTQSLRNRTWNIPTVTDGAIDALVAGGANSLSAPILAARAIKPDDVEDFLRPTLRALLPNPAFFLDMPIAANALADAIIHKRKIAIWSDYDVDGACSGAILGDFLLQCGVTDFVLKIPDRLTEGYGPNAPGLQALKDQGVDIVFVLDAGTTAFEPLQAGRDMGLTIVVIDHHAAEDTLPAALAVVNPNRRDQEPGMGHLCAAGVTFLLCVATNVELRKVNFFEDPKGLDMMAFLDLVALATVCDIVSLTTVNRAFVTRGLRLLSERARPGVAALAQVAACEDTISEKECGFALGPRINAGGRIGDSSMGARLLLEHDPDKAMAIAVELGRLNHERQTLEKSATQQAIEQARADWVPGVTRKLAIAIVEGHEGVVGISAARVKEALDAPAFVLALAHDGNLKGSGRSVSGFDLGSAVIDARNAGLLIKGGGHGMAAGITLDPERLEDFKAFMNDRINQSEYAQKGVRVNIDLALPITRATVGMVDAIQHLAPFGMGNPTPKFMIASAYVQNVQILSDKHVKVILTDPEMREAGTSLEALVWNEAHTPFGEALMSMKGKVVDAVGGLEINSWRNKRKVQMKLEDIRLAQDA